MRGIGLLIGLAAIVALSGFAHAAEPEVVTFETADKLTITGDLWSAGKKGGPAVVALHMYPSDRKSWRPLADRFRKAGVDFLAIDMRGYGDSATQRGKDISEKVRSRDPKHFKSMWKDALGAYEFLVERGADPGRVAFLGASVGCSVAIDAASREPKILGAAVLTPGTGYLGVETMKHLKGYGARPLLILSSKEEADVGANPIAKTLGESAELEIVPGKGIHGTRMFGKVPEIEDGIVKWLSDLVGGGIFLDGEVTRTEQVREDFGEWDMKENGRGTPVLRAAGRWLYAAIRMEGSAAAPERFWFGWARDGKADAARRIGCEFDKRGSKFTLEALDGTRWKAVKGGLPKGVRLGVSTRQAVEILVPRRLEGLAGEGDLKIAFGMKLRAGNLINVLPLADHGMNKVAGWLDYGLAE